MQTFQSIILITQNPEVDLLDLYHIDCTIGHADILQIKPETSIGIDDVRKVKDFTSRYPIVAAKKTIVIHSAHQLTLEAQNALLKLLEEPPEYVQLFLTTDHPESFLDTVISRCQLARSPLLKQESANNPSLLNELLAVKPACRLAKLPQLKGQAEAITLCQSLLYAARASFLSSTSQSTLQNYRVLERCWQQLKKNANPTIALSDAVLNLES